MRKITIEILAGQEKQVQIDYGKLDKSAKVTDKRLWTYLISYPYLIGFFEKAATINPSELILGNALVYGLMPTTMNIRKSNFEPLLQPLTRLKKEGLLLSKDEFLLLKNCTNNSVTGASKLLHFINPNLYPIWDSRINSFINGTSQNTNTIELYEKYLENFNELDADPRFAQIAESMSEKLDYTITHARAFEIIMYLSDLLGLEEKPIQVVLQDAKKGKTGTLQIPKYKRDTFTFISNLSEITADPLNPITLQRDGYLLSEHYTNNESIERALWIRSKRNLLISDNGNWTRMTQIANQFEDEGEEILDKAKQELENNEKVKQSTLDKRDALISKIAKACSNATKQLDIHGIIETQLKIKPHYMIGMEDFTIPVLMMCGMLDETFNPKASGINLYQEKTAAIFTQQVQGKFGFKEELQGIAKFMVLHAYDYESAYSGAKKTKNTPKDGVAISYGAPMRSKRWISKLEFGNKVEIFDEKLPEPYLIAQAMTLGAVNGYQDDTPIHILGVGSPILITLTGYLLRGSKAVSIDSTAPFKDAFAGKLYGNRHAFLKMRMYRVAALALVNNRPYESKTPFFKTFEKKYPSNWKALREKLKVDSNTNYKELAEELHSKQNLVQKYIPFFTKLKGGDDPMMWDLRIARSGHNYWVLKEICESIRERKNNPAELKKWTENEILRYKKIGSRKWAKAVEKAYQLTEDYRI